MNEHTPSTGSQPSRVRAAILSTSFATVAMLASGCGGGSDLAQPAAAPAPATVKGRFVDGPVGNLGYTCGTGGDATSGVTDSLGQFDYVPPAGGAVPPQCTFKVGDVVLGTAHASSLLTPFSLVAGSSPSDNPLSPKVVNIARFLQSIDADGNGSNGIAIQAETIAALSGKTLDFAASNFDALAIALLPAGKPLVSASAAGAALQSGMLATYAGNYSCTYSGLVNGANTVLGTVTVTISFDTLTGVGTPTFPTRGAAFDVNGTLTPAGVASTSTSTGAAFDGSFASDGTAAGTSGRGTWNDPAIGSGTWDCHHD